MNRGQIALVDAEDFDRLAVRCWGSYTTGYAVCREGGPGNKRILYMHREVLGDAAAGKVVDHINGNKLDNRKANLRVVGKSVNGLNRTAPAAHNTSGRTGVSFYKGKNAWVASIQVGRGKSRSCHTTFEDAVSAREVMERKILGHVIAESVIGSAHT